MGKIKVLSLAFCSMLFFSSCSFNIYLLPKQAPLKEKTVQGSGDAKILLLDISGFISERERSQGLGLTKKASMVEQIGEALARAKGDKRIKGLIVKVNSPGGTVTASDIIYHEIGEYRTVTGVPVYAMIMGLGASGGYYVASAADRIIAHPSSITGSIGVIALKFNIEGLMGKVGVKEETFKSGSKKDIMSPFRPTTEEERKIVQEIIDSMYREFLQVVLSGRKGILTLEELKPLADGRVYTAKQALSAKLIDDVGYLNEAIGRMKKELGVREARIITYYREGEYKGSIYSSYPSGGSLLSALVGDEKSGFSPLAGVEFMYLWMP